MKLRDIVLGSALIVGLAGCASRAVTKDQIKMDFPAYSHFTPAEGNLRLEGMCHPPIIPLLSDNKEPNFVVRRKNSIFYIKKEGSERTEYNLHTFPSEEEIISLDLSATGFSVTTTKGIHYFKTY